MPFVRLTDSEYLHSDVTSKLTHSSTLFTSLALYVFDIPLIRDSLTLLFIHTSPFNLFLNLLTNLSIDDEVIDDVKYTLGL